VESAPLVDRHLAIDAVGRKDHHAADRVPDVHELFALSLRDLIDDGCQPPEAWYHRIARQQELAELRAVMQVIRGTRDHELE
jgi:hypothetical protein